MKQKIILLIIAISVMQTLFGALPESALLANEEKAYGVMVSNIVERIPLWSALAPGETKADMGHYEFDAPKKVWRRKDVSSPEVVILKPSVVRSKTLVMIMPGGGYMSQYMGHVSNGARAILDSGRWVAVLHYRVPRRAGRAIYEAPFEDAARAVRILRSRAERYGYSPEKIGAAGFSAGAHLAVLLATSSQSQMVECKEKIDEVSCHLNFAVPVYPAYLLTDGATNPNANRGDGAKLLPEFAFDAKTPPMFLLHGDEDEYSSMGSVMLYSELHRRRIPAQMFIYSRAHHGLNDRVNVKGWQNRIVDWLESMDF